MSCKNADRNKQSGHDGVDSSSANQDSTPKTRNFVQDSTNILGDKIVLSNEKDVNGLSSPDTILILGEFNDSISAVSSRKGTTNDVELLNSRNYHYQGKSSKYILFSKNLADSITLTHFNYSIIFRIRPNNFADDMDLTPAQVRESYSNYDVSMLDSMNSVLMIKPKKEYSFARQFIRLIKFSASGLQQNSITLNDFIYTDSKLTEKGYVFALNDYGHGATNYFNNSPYSYKIVWLDKQLNLIETYQVVQSGTEITAVNYWNKQFSSSFEMHLACDICDWDFCKFDILFNVKLEPIKVVIWKQPKSVKLDPDTFLAQIKKGRVE